jgi:hypothetical protein
MAGPLRFAASLDQLGALPAAWLAAFAAVFIVLQAGSWREVWARLGWVFGAVLFAVFARWVSSVGLFVALCDFVGYESEDLPWGPLVKPENVAWLYLPWFLLIWPVLAPRLRRRDTTPPQTEAHPPAMRTRWLAGLGVAVLLVIGFWEPQGRPKVGKVLISTFHTQWSRTDRPYDRDWYGADSGYNYACLKRWFGTFYPVEELTGRIRADDLADASVLILYVPDRAFTEDERRLIESFVRRGGGLFLIGDHTNVFGSTSHLNAVCQPFGFFFRDDVLFDLDEDFFQLIDIPPLHSQFLHGMTFFKFRGPASIQPTSLSTRSVLTVDHAKSMRAIYSVNNFYPPPHDHPRMKTGRFCVSAASRFGEGRVVAFADSTIFSNFEIFYPGKYEYLLNVADWLNHRDRFLGTFIRRCALVLALGLVVFAGVQARNPRRCLLVLLGSMVIAYAAYGVALAAEQWQARFPVPVRPIRWLAFAADGEDSAYRLRAFTTEESYDNRYDVFIQWVLRTGVFSSFYLTETTPANALFEHLHQSGRSETALGLILRSPDQLESLPHIRSSTGLPHRRRLLLMFSREFDWEGVASVLQTAGLVNEEAALAQARGAWPQGEVLLQTDERSILVVFDAERFSDQAMGFSEKVVPNDSQRALFDQAYSLVDRLFDREKVGEAR